MLGERHQARRTRLKAARNHRYYRRKKDRRRLKERLKERGLIGSYDALLIALLRRRQALGLSQAALDFKAGLPDGYTGKLEARVRNLGLTSLPLVLGALGLRLALLPAETKAIVRSVEIDE